MDPTLIHPYCDREKMEKNLNKKKIKFLLIKQNSFRFNCVVCLLYTDGQSDNHGIR